MNPPGGMALPGGSRILGKNLSAHDLFIRPLLCYDDGGELHYFEQVMK